MEILSRLPFDLQEHILVKVMKRYKLRDGEYVRQIDKSKYKFLDHIMRSSINKDSYKYFHCVFNDDENKEIFHYRFSLKNLYDNPLRKESYVDDDIVEVNIERRNNIYYYEVSIYRLKLKNIDENNFTYEKMRKDIYHKGALADNYFWDFLEFSYEVK
jgi:hypothetical protein